MYRWSKIPEEYRPEIISDISDDKLYTFIVQSLLRKKFKRKHAYDLVAGLPYAEDVISSEAKSNDIIFVVEIAWEGFYEGIFKNIIVKNIPCVLMHKVKNKWAPEIDAVVCFMTGDTQDVFLVHPKDLTEWDPNEV